MKENKEHIVIPIVNYKKVNKDFHKFLKRHNEPGFELKSKKKGR